MAKKEKKKTKNGPGLLSRFGLPLILISIFSLAALSFFTLGLLSRGNKDLPASEPLKTALTEPIEVPPEFSRAAQSSDMGGPPPPPPESTGPSDGTTGANGAPGPPPPGTPENSPVGTADARGPATPPDLAAGQTGPESSPFPPPPDENAVPANTTASDSTRPAPAPPSGNDAAQPKTAGIPKPLWQSMDQNWDNVPDANLEDPNASWKQINVGQTDQTETGAVDVPTPPPPVKPASAKADTKKAGKPVASAKPAQSKPTYKKTRTSRRSIRKSTPSSDRVSVVVVNESGRPDQGQAYKEVLQAMGYRVRRVENRVPQPGPTTILYSAGLKTKARNLSQKIPGQKTMAQQPKGSKNEIVILVR